MCLRSESWAFNAPAFWHGPWSTTASLSLGWAVPDMACSEFRTGRTASLPRCLSTSVALSLTPSRPLFRQPSPPSCSTPFQSHPHAPPTRPCDKRMSFSLADLVTTGFPSSLPTLRQTISATSHSAILVSHCLILLLPIHPIPLLTSLTRKIPAYPLQQV